MKNISTYDGERFFAKLAAFIVGLFAIFFSAKSMADDGFCTTYARFGHVIYGQKKESEQDRLFFMNYGLHSDPAFLSLSNKDKSVFYRHLLRINKEVTSMPSAINDAKAYFYKKCIIESHMAINMIEKNNPQCKEIGAFAKYAYKQKESGVLVMELLQSSELPGSSEMNAVVYDVYKGVFKSSEDAGSMAYQKCLNK